VTHLLDTDHLTILQRGHGPEHAALLANMSRHPDEVGVSVVSLHEQARGALARIISARTRADLVGGYGHLFDLIEDYRQLPLVPFDDPAAVLFVQLRSQGVRIGTMDLRIAAIALSRNLTVVTRNARDFGQVPGLRTEDWTT